ncbi:MAG: hypothetical protein ACKN9F_08225 [Methylomonas sp.]
MVNSFLNQLHGVKQTGPNKWLARCPAHDDRSPSLAIRVADDDKVLVHCFGGCSVSEVLDSVGLELSDLFPKQTTNSKPQNKPRFNASELIRLCVQESMILVVAISDCLAGKSLSDEDQARVERAVDTLMDTYREVTTWR